MKVGDFREVDGRFQVWDGKRWRSPGDSFVAEREKQKAKPVPVKPHLHDRAARKRKRFAA